MKLAEFNEIVRKRPAEPFWLSRYFWRHITIPFSWICSLLRVKADHVTVISLIVGMLGGLCFCWPTTWGYLGGLIFIQGWSFLDHVDGELARYEIKYLKNPPSLAGPYLDLLVHRWVQPFYHVCMSISLLRLTDNWGWLILGYFAGANYFGFAKSQADSLVLRSLVRGNTQVENPALAELVDLGHLIPSSAERGASGIKKLIAFSKWLKNGFAFPGCLVMICVVVAIDVFVFRMKFVMVAGIPWSATFAYLFLQACIAVGQNVAGTWYVATLLRRLP